MQLAYSISGYKLPRQFRWLLEAIWHEDDVFLVHVDARTPAATMRAFEEVAAGRDNVRFIARRKIVWMGMGLVQAELDAIAAAHRLAPDFDYLLSLSMQDYPLQPRSRIVAELEAAGGKNFISMEPLRDLPFHIRRRPHLLSFEWRDRLVKTPLPRLRPRDVAIDWKGSWWRVLSHDFCAWLLEAPETRRYAAFLRHVQAPDELFFQNLIMASPFRDRLADRNRHLVFWSGDGGSPDTITMAHRDKLESSPLWFARKFDETVDHDVLAWLAARIGAPVPSRAGLAA